MESLLAFIRDKSDHVAAAATHLKPLAGCEAYAPPVQAYLDCVSTALCAYAFMIETAKSDASFRPPRAILEEHFAPAVRIAYDFFAKTAHGLDAPLAGATPPSAAAAGHQSPGKTNKPPKREASSDRFALDAKAKRSFAQLVRRSPPLPRRRLPAPRLTRRRRRLL